MRLDKLPVGEAIVGFLLVALVATFLIARSEVDSGDSAEAGGEPTASAEPSGPPGGVEITMTDNKFDHTELTLAAGTEVTIPLTNNGIAIHNVHVAGEGGTYGDAFCTLAGPNPCSDPVRIPGGDTGTLAFIVPNTPGAEIPYRCDFHASEMTGTITVQ